MSQIRVFNFDFTNNTVRSTIRNLGASAVAAALCIIPTSVVSAGQIVADATDNDYEIFSFSQNIGSVKANSEICGATEGVHSAQVMEIINTATFVARARYRQLGLTEDDEKEGEKNGEQSAKDLHNKLTSSPDCKIFDRQLDALIWRTAYQGVDFIRRSQHKSGS